MNWLRSPLIQFVAVGAVIFFLYGMVRGSRVDPREDGRRIEVDEQQIERLSELFTAQWRRPPTASELEGLIESHIREEILYREAIAMGLDQDDTVVRRRMAQKLELLADDLATRQEPTREELQRYLDENLDRYGIPGRASFTQVYFSVDRRGESAEPDARVVLERLRAGGDPREAGDPFMLEDSYPLRTPREIADLFGADFAEGLFELPAGTWEGPVRSSYGFHLVQIHERTPSRSPELSEVSDRVRNDLLNDRRREASDALLESLKERYDIVVAGR